MRDGRMHMSGRTKDEWLAEIEKIRGMDAPDEKKARLYYDLAQEMDRQIAEEKGSDALGYIPDASIILNLPVKGMGITYGELCEKEGLDWLTGKPILD